MLRVRIASSEEFQSSRDAWNALVDTMPFPTVFCTWEWIFTWWEYYGSNYEILILFIYDEDAIKGILPLCCEKGVLRKDGVLGHVLTFCGSKELYSDYVDIIASEKDVGDCLEAVFDFLRTEHREWSVLKFSHVLAENGVLSSLRSGRGDWTYQEYPVSFAPHIKVAGTFEEYSGTLDKSFMKKLNRCRRSLYSGQGFSYFPLEGSRILEGLGPLFCLHGERAAKKRIASTFDDRKIFHFHYDLLRRVWMREWAWIRCLGNEENIIAVSYSFVFNRRVCAYQKGFSSEWAHYSPGSIVNFETIHETFARQLQEYDFLRGDEAHKSRWTRCGRELLNVEIFNDSPTGRASSCMSRLRTLLRSNGTEARPGKVPA